MHLQHPGHPSSLAMTLSAPLPSTGPGSALPRHWVEELGKLSRRLPSAREKQSAAGIDHPRAIPTPHSEAKPISVFFSWGAGLAGGSRSWRLTGNRCGRGGRGGEVEGSQEMDTTQVRAQGAVEIKQPLSTVGGRESMGGQRL